MALSAGGHQIGRIDGGTWVCCFLHGMGRMTIGTTGDLFRVAESIVFPVITVHVSTDRHIEDIVTLHHLLVTVALQADLGMKYPVGMELRVIHRLNIVEIMTIVASGGILIACRHCLPVDGLPVNCLMVVALDTLGNDNTFVIFPVSVRMYVGVAIGALNILLYMNAGIMLGIFLFVTALAPDLLHFDCTFHVPGKVGKLDMAAIAAVFPMNGSDKSSGGNLITVATEAGGRINSHAQLSPQRVGKQQTEQDRRRHSGNYLQYAKPPAK
jgi:hypothetical protein